MRKMLFLVFALLALLICLTACDLTALGELIAPATTTAEVTTTEAVSTTTSAVEANPAATTVPPVTTAPVTTSPAPEKRVPTIEGTRLDDYTILVTEENEADAEMLARLLLADHGVTLPLAASADGPSIFLSSDPTASMTACTINPAGDRITITGRGLNGTYLAALALRDLLAEAAITAPYDLTLENGDRQSVSKHVNPLTKELFYNDGSFRSERGGELNIAFLGGSLTQDKTGWTEPVANLFREWFPEKTVNTLNAGIGATNSELGAARLAKDVFSKMIPDILFVDYAVNDHGFTAAELAADRDAAIIKNGAYIESIIKQCRALEEPPIIILLYFPVGSRVGSSTHNSWKNGTILKDEIAAHYGIGTVDVWAHYEQLYLEALKTEPTLTYNDFVLRYYSASDKTHPRLDGEGYRIFADAIINAIKETPEQYLINRISADTYLTDYEEITELTYSFIPPDGDGVLLSEAFTHHTETAYTSDDPRHIPAIRIKAPQLEDGVLQCETGDFSITLKTSATYLKLYGINSPEGMTVDVYVGGVLCGSISTNAANTYLYFAGVKLPDSNGTSRLVTIVPSEDNGDNTVFRFGYIVLGE